MNKKIIVGLVVVLVIAIGGYFFPSVTNKIVGAVPTLDGVDFPFTKIGGLREYNYSQAIMATSSVICSTKITATSTLKAYTVLGLTNGLGAQTFDVSTSSTAYGTSSPAYIRGYSTGATGFALVWGNGATTTNASLIGGTVSNNVGNSDNVIFPNQYVNVKIATSTAGTFGSYFTGRCSGKFQEL